MATTLSLRLPSRLAQELGKLAEAVERPKSYLVRKAVETYLAEYADYQLALERLHDRDEATVSGHELRKTLGL
jgi:RHH-type rel operon transcriptional repressor/antitoxin RelB